MPRKCSVYGCKGNYKSSLNSPDSSNVEKISCYRFPKDPEERLKWINALPNKINPSDITDNMTVCSKHFAPDCRMKRWGKYSIPLDPPDPALCSVAGKESCSRAPPSKPRQTKNSNPPPINEDEQLDEFHSLDKFETYKRDIFDSMLLSLAEQFEGSITSVNNNRINFHSFNRDGPIHSYCVFLELNECDENDVIKSIKCEVYRGLMRIKHGFVGDTVCGWDALTVLFKFVATGELNDSEDKLRKFSFVTRQVQLLNTYTSHSYDTSDLVHAFTWLTTSRALYSSVRDFLKLPSISTLRTLTCSAKKTADNQLFKSFFGKQDARSKGCMLIVDEMYVKSSLHYLGNFLFVLYYNIF